MNGVKHSETLSEILKKSPEKSWAHWVALAESPAAEETRALLNTCFLGLAASKQSAIAAKIRREKDAANADAILYELVTNELLHRFALKPDFDPKINQLTPDIAVEIEGQRFIIDVFVTHSPQKTVKDHGDGTGEAVDDGDRARKIFRRIEEKAEKYARTQLPLLLFVYLGDHRILSANDIQKALFGLTIGEISPGERFQDTVAARKFGGVFFSNVDDDGGWPRHRNLSAVVVCDWFDSLNKDHGRRLGCSVLHHYNPAVPLPYGTFSPFQEISWQPIGPTHWDPRVIGQPNIVAKFAADRQWEFGSYRADKAW
jgi:hypothetical protein